jgi:hypothetical protein
MGLEYNHNYRLEAATARFNKADHESRGGHQKVSLLSFYITGIGIVLNCCESDRRFILPKGETHNERGVMLI